jgi:hypothetical protein
MLSDHGEALAVRECQVIAETLERVQSRERAKYDEVPNKK